MERDDFDLNNLLPELGNAQSEYIERPIGQRTFFFFLIATLAIAGIVFLRVGFLNVVNGERYKLRSAGNANKEIATPAFRGLITDRYGEVLAKNAETFSVFVNLSELLKNKENLDPIISKLAQSLELSKEEIEEALANSNIENSSIVPIIRNISTPKAIALKGKNLESVYVVNDFRREYIDGEIFAHVIGYTGVAEKGNDIVGKVGLEDYYNEYLVGQDGIYVQYRDAYGEIINEQAQSMPISGHTLETTLDAGLQRFFYNRLQQGLTELGRKSAIGIAMETSTGEILSLISIPSYDNNIFVTSGKNKEINELFSDQSQPLFNRAVSGAYSPASTIKPLVGLAALREEVADDIFGVESTGQIEIPNPYNPSNPSIFLDWKAHGWVNIRSALARSSNVYFYVVGGGFEDLVGLGIDRLNKYWKFFQFGEKTGIDLSSEVSGFLPSPEEKEKRTGQPWRVGDTYNVSIGQGDLLVNPLQLIRFYASIAEDGKMFSPKLTRSITNPDGQVIYRHQAELILDYSDWEFELSEVQAGLEHAVSKDYGTAHLLNSLEMEVAGKTGSAQVQNNTKTNAIFLGYAPRENPEIVILILVEDAKEGSLNTIPIAKDVFNWYYENRIER